MTDTSITPDVEDVASSRPLRKDAARNRAALIEAARTVFAERGLDASLDDIAHAAGVGVGTAYRHFANKYELAEAILRQAIDDVIALAERCAAEDDPWAALEHFLEGACLAQTGDRGLREVLMGMHDETLSRETSDRISGPIGVIVERAHAAGALRADIESSDVGFLIFSLCTIADIAADVSPELWRRYLPMFLDGLRGTSPLPLPAIGTEDMQLALASHKRRLGGGARR